MSVQELYDQAAHRLGCATGTLGMVLKQAYSGSEITGVDISPRMIKLADKRGCYGEVLVRDLNEALAFSDDSFDLVVALGFMEFLEDPISTLKEVNRVLKPGGTALVSFQEHWLDKPELAPRTTRSGVVSHHAYTIEESIDLLKTSGMEVISAISEIGYTSSAGFSCPYVFCKGEATR